MAKTSPAPVAWRFNGALLRRRRQELGLTLVAAAEACQLTTRGIELLEHDLQQPGGATITKLTRGLACEPGYFFEPVEP